MDISPIPVDLIHHSLWNNRDITLGILRLDQIHPFVSGNKWFKLHQNAVQFQSGDFSHLLTFGGAFSNHLHATAHYCNQHKIPCIGIVRGEELKVDSNPTLQDCAALGMALYFVPRAEYRLKEHGATARSLASRHQICFVPEGGDNPAGRAGAAGIMEHIPGSWGHIAVSIGTGTTIKGMMDAAPPDMVFLGCTSVRNDKNVFLACEAAARQRNFQWIDQYHFGGFGRYNNELITFVKAFHEQFRIPLDIVYTAKMMYGILDMLGKGMLSPGSRILCVHTGGLQGNRSVPGLKEGEKK
ncbi:MAG: pyridoxal-phosphate dependent enzyme [Taibaiella sp.]|nr:pyridoxal-phosphate dependent enzyme [Taibaiella sp.]